MVACSNLRLLAAAAALAFLALAAAAATVCSAQQQQQLRRNYYASVCPNVESIVRDAVASKYRETFITVGATVHLFFHDCFVEGCDASVVVASTPNSTAAEKDHPVNLSLAGDGFDTVIRAKAAVDAVPQPGLLRRHPRHGHPRRHRAGRRPVLRRRARPPRRAELDGEQRGREAGAADVQPGPADRGVRAQRAVAGGHGGAVGRAHGGVRALRHVRRAEAAPDPTMNGSLAAKLAAWCPDGVDPRVAVTMDVVTPRVFDNQYFRNLQAGMGLLASDQLLYTDTRSRPIVDALARSSVAFERAFVEAITKMGRIGVKTGAQGNIRRNCAVLN